MKNVLLDICLALLILLLGQSIFDENRLDQDLLEQQIAAFNDDVEKGTLEEHYRLAKETEPNKVSRWVEEISDLSRDGIRVAVDAISEMMTSLE